LIDFFSFLFSALMFRIQDRNFKEREKKKKKRTN
jgi:hypothetical protein